MKPDYREIAKSMVAHGLSADALALALDAAYERGSIDGLSPDETHALVMQRVERHVRSLDQLGREIHELTEQIRGGS